MTAERPRIFWSWQSDYSQKTCRWFIREALAEAAEQAAKELDLNDAERPELDHDTQGEQGMVEITKTIFDKIQKSEIFVADLTPIAKSDKGKWLPNPNVLVELGWAMQTPGPERIIGILNLATGAKTEDLPFDIRHRRIVSYNLSENADSNTKRNTRAFLVATLKDALLTNLRNPQHTSNQDIKGVQEKNINYSIWNSASSTLRHTTTGRSQFQEIEFPDMPRAYMRIIPSAWSEGVPSIHAISELNPGEAIEPSSSGAYAGNVGSTEEGYVRYWVHSRPEPIKPQALNVTMFFDRTGEFWDLHGTSIGTLKSRPTLRYECILAQWSITVLKAIKLMDRLGAKKYRRVEAGFFGAKNTFWPNQWGDGPPSRRNDDREIRDSSDWSPQAQLSFLNSASNRLRNMYSQPPLTESAFSERLETIDQINFKRTIWQNNTLG